MFGMGQGWAKWFDADDDRGYYECEFEAIVTRRR